MIMIRMSEAMHGHYFGVASRYLLFVKTTVHVAFLVYQYASR